MGPLISEREQFKINFYIIKFKKFHTFILSMPIRMNKLAQCSPEALPELLRYFNLTSTLKIGQ